MENIIQWIIIAYLVVRPKTRHISIKWNVEDGKKIGFHITKWKRPRGKLPNSSQWIKNIIWG